MLPHSKGTLLSPSIIFKLASQLHLKRLLITLWAWQILENCSVWWVIESQVHVSDARLPLVGSNIKLKKNTNRRDPLRVTMDTETGWDAGGRKSKLFLGCIQIFIQHLPNICVFVSFFNMSDTMSWWFTARLLLFSHSVIFDSLWLHGLQSARFLCPWISQARILEWVATSFSRGIFPS